MADKSAVQFVGIGSASDAVGLEWLHPHHHFLTTIDSRNAVGDVHRMVSILEQIIVLIDLELFTSYGVQSCRLELLGGPTPRPVHHPRERPTEEAWTHVRMCAWIWIDGSRI